MQYQLFIRLFLSSIFAISLPAAAASSSQDAAKLSTVKTMYQQDISNEGSVTPVLTKFASPELAQALKLEQDYFDKTQMICGTGADVIWDSQDPDFVMPKLSAQNGKIKAHLSHGSEVYYQLECTGDTCKINDVTLDGVKSLQSMLTANCK